ncbi:MAG: hypothetical protein ABIV94_04265 [Acidimicrobiales bacterium]
MTTPRLLAASVLCTVASTVFVLVSAGSAAASCAPPLPTRDAITQADAVVVGTVTATRSHDRVATVAVDEVWKGEVGNTLEVFGGPDPENAATSVDRTYEIGVRYLIVAFEPAAHGSPGAIGGRYEDNACSATQPWSDALKTLRPDDARVLTPATATPPPVPRLAADHRGRGAVGIAAIAAVGALSLTVWWKRRRGRGLRAST